MRKTLSSFVAPLGRAFTKAWRPLATYYTALINHSDFDTWIYLVLYSMIDLFCWCVIIGILSRCAVEVGLHAKNISRLADMFGPQSGLIWLDLPKPYIEPVMIMFNVYWVNKKAEQIRDRFHKLEMVLTHEDGNPFASWFTYVPIYWTGGWGFAIGYLPIVALDCGETIASYPDHIVDIYDHKPRIFAAALTAVLIATCTLSWAMAANPERLDLQEIPPTFLASRIANSIVGYLRKRRAVKRMSAASSVLSLLDDQTSEYQYERLRPGQFRLLELDADRGCARLLTSDFFRYSWFSGVKFDAVSYLWGEDIKSHAITIDDGIGRLSTIKITKNAHDAIAASFPLHGVCHLWIDSICINQGSPQEKASQIPHMRFIYGRAERVVAYLGSSISSSRANNFLARAIWHAVSFSGFKSSEPFRTSVPFPSDYYGWKALRELAENELWSRVWVLQEILVAEKLVICNGDADFPWRMMVQFELSFKGYRMKAPYTDLDGRAPGSKLYSEADLSTVHLIMLNHRIAREQGGGHELVDLLLDTRHFKSTRAEDKVYALLGVSDAYNEPSLRPDPTKSVEDVYTAATLYCLQRNKFEIFSIAGTSRQIQRTSKQRGERNTQLPNNKGKAKAVELHLPSWVPNFRDQPWYASFELYNRGYKASGGDAMNIGFEHKDGGLDLYGWEIDRIYDCAEEEGRPGLGNYPFHFETEDLKKRTDTWHTPNHPDSALRRMRLILEEMRDKMRGFTAQEAPHVVDISVARTDLDEVVALTAIENFDGKSYPAPKTILDSYYIFKIMMGMVDMAAGSEGIVSSGMTKKYRKLIRKFIDNALWLPFFQRAEAVSFQRKFAKTENGRAAMVPKGTKKGYIIFIFEGSPVPHILREVSGQRYELFGDAYVHGVMAGEATDGIPWRITLV